MQPINQTLNAVDQHGWQVVLLAPKSKRPTGETWQITRDPDIIYNHYWKGGNLGLVCGPESNVMVLDFDKPGAYAEMCEQLDPILTWVETGSGKSHCYFLWEEGMPAKMEWCGEKIGEIQRGPAKQHVVMPPSTHPSGGPYLWLRDPAEPLLRLPDTWRKHFKEEAVPSFIPVGNREGQPADEVWNGPSADEILRRARMQPGSKRRRNGIKFQCPGCRKEGHDKSMDNAIVYDDGRWGCAISSSHSRDIGEVLGVVSVQQEVLGDSADDLRDVSIDDLD